MLRTKYDCFMTPDHQLQGLRVSWPRRDECVAQATQKVKSLVHILSLKKEILRENCYPPLDAHASYHAHLKKKLMVFLECGRTNPVAVNTEFLGFLKTWLQQHIAVEDRSAFNYGGFSVIEPEHGQIST